MMVVCVLVKTPTTRAATPALSPELRLAHSWHAAELGDLPRGHAAAQDRVKVGAKGDDAARARPSIQHLASRLRAG